MKMPEKKNHKNIRSETTHNNSHLITPSRSQSVRRDNETAFGCSTKWSLGEKDSQERKEEEKKIQKHTRKVCEKANDKYESGIKVEIYKCRPIAATATGTHTFIGAYMRVHRARTLRIQDASKYFGCCIAAQSIPFIYIVCLSHSVHTQKSDRPDTNTHTHPASDC